MAGGGSGVKRFFLDGRNMFFFDDGDDLINWGIDHVGEKRELL